MVVVVVTWTMHFQSASGHCSSSVADLSSFSVLSRDGWIELFKLLERSSVLSSANESRWVAIFSSTSRVVIPDRMPWSLSFDFSYRSLSASACFSLMEIWSFVIPVLSASIVAGSYKTAAGYISPLRKFQRLCRALFYSITVLYEGISDVENVWAVVEPNYWEFGDSDFLVAFYSRWSRWVFTLSWVGVAILRLQLLWHR